MDYPIKTLDQLRPLLIGLRKRAGMTQAAVAALLGITQQSYAKIEASPSTTSAERLFTIVRLLGGEMVLRHPDHPESKQRPRPGAPSKITPPPSAQEPW